MVALIERAGGEAVIRAPGWTAGDDFGFYSQKRPSVYFRLGIRSEAKGSTFALHHPAFRVDEDALPLGAETLTAAALDFLKGEGN
jgi:amidohydrolase